MQTILSVQRISERPVTAVSVVVAALLLVAAAAGTGSVQASSATGDARSSVHTMVAGGEAGQSHDFHTSDATLQSLSAKAEGGMTSKTYDVLSANRSDDDLPETTIRDNHEEPRLALSVSSDVIAESGATTSTVTVVNTKKIAKPRNQTVTVTFGGPAVYGDDYTVSPADADDNAPGHQMTLRADTPHVSLTITAVDDSVAELCEWIDVSATFGKELTPVHGAAQVVIQDDEGSPDTITPVTVGLSGIVTGNLTVNDEGQDWHSFEATSSERYIIEVKQPLEFAVEKSSFGVGYQVPGYLADPSIIEVTDDQMSQVLGERDQGGFTLNWARAFFTPDETGTYYIKVGAGANDRGGFGCYTITVRVDDHADDFMTEHGVALQPGGAIIATVDSDVAYDDPGLNFWDWNSNPDPAPGDDPGERFRPRRGIESLDDRDVFRYEISEAGSYLLGLTSQSTDIGIWYIWDSQGNLFWESEGDPVSSVVRRHEPGVYYAEVGTPYASEGNTDTYVFYVEDDS